MVILHPKKSDFFADDQQLVYFRMHFTEDNPVQPAGVCVIFWRAGAAGTTRAGQ
jgi:hypothetical protein